MSESKFYHGNACRVLAGPFYGEGDESSTAFYVISGYPHPALVDGAELSNIRSGYYRQKGCATGDILWRSQNFPPPLGGWEYLGDRWPA